MASGGWLIVVPSSLGRRRLCRQLNGYAGRIRGHRALAAVARRWWGGLLLEAHAVLLHRLQLGLQRHDRRALGFDRLLGGGVRSPEVGD